MIVPVLVFAGAVIGSFIGTYLCILSLGIYVKEKEKRG